MSQRRACEALRVDRPSVRYRSTRPADLELREAMKAVASERRRFGYRRIHVMLQRRASGSSTLPTMEEVSMEQPGNYLQEPNTR